MAYFLAIGPLKVKEGTLEIVWVHEIKCVEGLASADEQPLFIMENISL